MRESERERRMIFGKMDKAFIIGAKRTKMLKNIFFLLVRRLHKLHRFFSFFYSQRNKGNKKDHSRTEGANTGHRGTMGGISNPPCMADTKKEMPNAGKGMREGGNEE